MGYPGQRGKTSAAGDFGEWRQGQDAHTPKRTIFIVLVSRPGCAHAFRRHLMVLSTVQIEKAFAAWPQVEPALRVPRNEREYRQLVKLLDRLVDEVGEDEEHPLASMMEVLGVLVENYEDEHMPEPA